MVLLLACCSSGGNSESDAGDAGDVDTDADGDSDCMCVEQQPETFGDCEAGEAIEPTVTEIVETNWIDCLDYIGPTTPEAEAEVEFFIEEEGGDPNRFAVFKGDTGWADYKDVCMASDSFLTEADFPAVDFSTQRVVIFYGFYKYDCWVGETSVYDDHRIGDLGDGTVQVNGYVYKVGGDGSDCEADGQIWEMMWFVVLNTTSQVRACLELAVTPPE